MVMVVSPLRNRVSRQRSFRSSGTKGVGMPRRPQFSVLSSCRCIKSAGVRPATNPSRSRVVTGVRRRSPGMRSRGGTRTAGRPAPSGFFVLSSPPPGRKASSSRAQRTTRRTHDRRCHLREEVHRAARRRRGEVRHTASLNSPAPFATERGWTVIEDYVDDGISGRATTKLVNRASDARRRHGREVSRR